MYQIKVGETEYQVEPTTKDGREGRINDSEYKLDLVGEGDRFHLLHNNRSFQIDMVKADFDSKSFTLMVNGNTYELEARDRFDLLLEELGMGDLAAGVVNDLKAPMPGLVLEVQVNEGEEVKKGDSLLVLEAMKMENVLKAEQDAVVKKVPVQNGQAVEKNQVLIAFEDQG